MAIYVKRTPTSVSYPAEFNLNQTEAWVLGQMIKDGHWPAYADWNGNMAALKTMIEKYLKAGLISDFGEFYFPTAKGFSLNFEHTYKPKK